MKPKGKVQIVRNQTKRAESSIFVSEDMVTLQDLIEGGLINKDTSREELVQLLRRWLLAKLNEIEAFDRRLDMNELYGIMKVVYNVAVIVEHRCAAVHTINGLLFSLGFSESNLQKFIDSNIKKESDCGDCRICFEEQKAKQPEFVFMYDAPPTVH